MSEPVTQFSKVHTAGRRSFVGGSDARIIMGDDEAALHRLWRQKRGEEEPEDLSSNLIVQLGVVTEHLNRQWFERNTGQTIKDVQRRVSHPVVKWMAATLDGTVEATGAGAANGSRSRSRPTLSTSTSYSQPRRSSGAAWRAASRLVCSGSSRHGHALRPFGLST